MTLRNVTFMDESNIIIFLVMAKMMIVKSNIKTFFNNSSAPVENSVGYYVRGVTKENSLVRFRLEFSKVILLVQHKTPTSEDVKEFYARLLFVQPFVRCFCCSLVDNGTVLHKAGSLNNFGPEVYGEVCKI